MKVWHIWQNKFDGYDTYDSAVVVADTEDAARRVSPDGDILNYKCEVCDHSEFFGSCWPRFADDVSAEIIGELTGDFENFEVICASFNAG